MKMKTKRDPIQTQAQPLQAIAMHQHIARQQSIDKYFSESPPRNLGTESVDSVLHAFVVHSETRVVMHRVESVPLQTGSVKKTKEMKETRKPDRQTVIDVAEKVGQNRQ